MTRLRGRAAMAFRDLVVATYGDTCHICGRPGADTADHLVPVKYGGANTLENCRPAHRRCNSRRGAPQSAPPTVDDIAFFRDTPPSGTPAPPSFRFPRTHQENQQIPK